MHRSRCGMGLENISLSTAVVVLTRHALPNVHDNMTWLGMITQEVPWGRIVVIRGVKVAGIFGLYDG